MDSDKFKAKKKIVIKEKTIKDDFFTAFLKMDTPTREAKYREDEKKRKKDLAKRIKRNRMEMSQKGDRDSSSQSTLDYFGGPPTLSLPAIKIIERNKKARQ